MSGYDDLIPETRRVTVAGREIEVGVLRMWQIPGFSRAIAKPWPAIVTGDYLAVIIECPDEVTEALRVATGLETAFLQELRPDEFLALAAAVFEVNLDFFARAVFPAATALAVTLRTAMTRSGSSPGSSPPDTATPTSLN